MTQNLIYNVELASLEDSQGIYNTFKLNLFEMKNVDEISKNQKKELEQAGFLRKEVDLNYYIKLIEDPIIDIYVAKKNSGEIIGFVSIFTKKYCILNVRDITGNFSFKNNKSKDLLLNEKTEFAYLDQVSILPEFKRKGIGTAIFQKALLKLDIPVVAFIVEKPLFNKASAYWHKYNGFKFSARNEGEYKGKSIKFQVYIHWNGK